MRREATPREAFAKVCDARGVEHRLEVAREVLTDEAFRDFLAGLNDAAHPQEPKQGRLT